MRSRPWKLLILNVLLALIGWILVWPITWIVPRNRGFVVFLGRDGGKFIDNCKHLYASTVDRDDSAVDWLYLATDWSLCRRIEQHGGRARAARSASGCWAWLRAGTIIVDSVDWRRPLRFQGSRGARVVQLWHGIPLKVIQRSRMRLSLPTRAWLDRVAYLAYLTVQGRLSQVDWLLSTSQYITDRAFRDAFKFNHVSHAGYPRNDMLFGSERSLSRLGVDGRAESAIQRARREKGKRICLYAPTFREALEDPFATGELSIAEFGKAANSASFLLLIKLHPWMHDRMRTGERPGIQFVAPDSDIYPLLDQVDLLVTDYSSIYFDFLLLDRPIVFFSYDLEKYLSSERAMYFDYEEMTPGPKVRNMTDLERELRGIVNGRDEWQVERARIRNLVFDHAGPGASNRLLAELFRES